MTANGRQWQSMIASEKQRITDPFNKDGQEEESKEPKLVTSNLRKVYDVSHFSMLPNSLAEEYITNLGSNRGIEEND